MNSKFTYTWSSKSQQETSRNPFFKGKLPACQLKYGRCVVCPGGGYPSWSIQRGGTPADPSRGGGTPAGPSRGGVPWSTSVMTTSMMTTSGGSTSMTTSRGVQVHFHDHFQGGYPSWSIQGGTPADPSRGVPQLVHPEGVVPWSTSVMTTSVMTTSGGVHLHDHFWGGPLPWPLLGGPIWPSHHPLDLTSLLSRHQLMGLACYSSLYTLLPQCILGRSHGTPPSWTDWQTNMSENITFLQTTYAGSN